MLLEGRGIVNQANVWINSYRFITKLPLVCQSGFLSF